MRLLSVLVASAAIASQVATAVRLPDLTSAVEAFSWQSCGSDDDAFIPTAIIPSPNPPVPGQELNVTVVGTVKKEIEEGAYVDVTVKLGVIKILHKQFDLCEEARKAEMDITCPVAEDKYTITQTVQLPAEVPKAVYHIDVLGYTKDDDNLACVKIVVNFLNRVSPLDIQA